MFWKGHLFFVVFNNKSTIIKTFLCTSNNHFIFKSLKKEAKQEHFRHLHLISIATLCYILLHHRYMLLLTCIIVTYCYSTPLLIDTSFYAILKEKMLFRFCVGFFVLCRWFRQGCRGRGGGLNRKKLRL